MATFTLMDGDDKIWTEVPFSLTVQIVEPLGVDITSLSTVLTPVLFEPTTLASSGVVVTEYRGNIYSTDATDTEVYLRFDNLNPEHGRLFKLAVSGLDKLANPIADTFKGICWPRDLTYLDAVNRGLSEILAKYVGKPRLNAWLTSLLRQIESVDDLAFEYYARRWPYTAEGVQLDAIGKIVNYDRPGVSDDLYRMFLVAVVLANKSNGTFPELHEILDICGVLERWFWHSYPASLELVVTGFAWPEHLREILRRWQPGGVDFRFAGSETPASNCFILSTPNQLTPDTQRGLSNPAQTTGGLTVRSYQ